MFHFVGLIGLNLGQEFFLKKVTSHAPAKSAASIPVLREGTPVPLIVVDGFDVRQTAAGETVTFVLAEDLTQNGKTLARTGDVASGLMTKAGVPGTPDGLSGLALQNVTLRARGATNVPLRTNQVRGANTPVQYKELQGSGKVEFTLFVAENVLFTQTE